MSDRSCTRITALRADPAFASLRRSLEVYYGDASARRGHGCALRPLPAPGRPRLRHRHPRRRPHRQLSPRSARAWWRWSRSRCARAPSGRSTRATTDVTLIEAACGDHAGTLTLRINSANPTVSTASRRVRVGGRRRRRLGGPGLGRRPSRCPATTLDALIAEHGARRSPRSTWRASRRPCSPACRGLCRRFPSSSPPSSATWRCLPRSASLARALRLRRGARREPGADLRPLDLPGRDGRPPRRPAARGQLRGRLLCSAELTLRA